MPTSTISKYALHKQVGLHKEDIVGLEHDFRWCKEHGSRYRVTVKLFLTWNMKMAFVELLCYDLHRLKKFSLTARFRMSSWSNTERHFVVVAVVVLFVHQLFMI